MGNFVCEMVTLPPVSCQINITLFPVKNLLSAIFYIKERGCVKTSSATPGKDSRTFWLQYNLLESESDFQHWVRQKVDTVSV